MVKPTHCYLRYPFVISATHAGTQSIPCARNKIYVTLFFVNIMIIHHIHWVCNNTCSMLFLHLGHFVSYATQLIYTQCNNTRRMLLYIANTLLHVTKSVTAHAAFYPKTVKFHA